MILRSPSAMASPKTIPSKAVTLLVLCAFLLSATGCKKKHLKTIGALIVVGVAAKLIYDMIIEHRSEQTQNDRQVVNKYKDTHNELPDEPELLNYQTHVKPGGVINPGNKVSIVSNLEVVRSKHKETFQIEEKITIYDNEDNSKPLKSLVKVVNQDTKKCGAFENEFTFTLPKGMPQGVYPIKTSVIVDGKEYQVVENKMQLVFQSQPSSTRLVMAD